MLQVCEGKTVQTNNVTLDIFSIVFQWCSTKARLTMPIDEQKGGLTELSQPSCFDGILKDKALCIYMQNRSLHESNVP